jgi:hypothetical protein
MADSVTVTNFPDSGSAERVAFDVAKLILVHNQAGGYTEQRVLDLFADCLKVARSGGYRLSELG